jgi:localization factor PodJL
MRAELPWNVAGIPPEAREAARAAARREGLSVGEWLTRRILRSFSELGEEQAAMSFDRNYERAVGDRSMAGRATLDRPVLDAWGLPTQASRDTEEVLSRINRTEADASDAYHRIEEHLRTVQRRLDSAERSQSENNRAMSKTATEINIATREQAQAFDQLAGHVLDIGERLEKLERNAGHESLKDAVRALHHGLSRLAEQIGQTASQSAEQVSILSSNLEQLAGRLGQVRSEIEATAERLEARVAKAEEDARERFAAAEQESRNRFAAFEAETQRTLDQRLAVVEKASQFNTSALDHALEKLEAQAGMRASDQADSRRRHAEIETAIGNLEEALQRLEPRGPDTGLERRLDGIERALESLMGRLDTHNPNAGLEDSLRAMGRRIDGIERNHVGPVEELRANPAPSPLVSEPLTVDPPAEAPTMPAMESPAYDPVIFAHEDFPQTEFADPPPADLPPETEVEAPPPFTPEPAPDMEMATAAELPPPASEEAIDDIFADRFTGSDESVPFAEDTDAAPDFLAAARRSAQAAADAEAKKDSGFSWPFHKTESSEQPRHTVPVILGILLLLALAGFLLIQ